VPETEGQSASTPFKQYQAPQAPGQKREELDARIRRLPSLEGLLVPAVNDHYKKLKEAYATKLKLMIAELPLVDRQILELGDVELFTLRGETGEIVARETDEKKAASRARQGTLLRAEHESKVYYYEVFATGKIVRRDDLPEALALDGVIKYERYPSPYGGVSLPVRRGTELQIDFNAYATGSPPRKNVAPAKVIVEQLGGRITGRSLPESHTMATFVPNSYSSTKIASIARKIVEGNFYETPASLLERARELLPLEKRREARTRDHNILLGLVPFVGAYQEFAAGNIGRGFANLAVDLVGVAIGVGGQARALIRSAKALTPNPLSGIIGRLRPSVAPLTPKLTWTKPPVAFSDRAFDFVKESVLFASAGLNPLDGYMSMTKAATKGLIKLPQLLATGTAKFGKMTPHLITMEEKLRCYWMVAAGQSSDGREVGAEPVVVERQNSRNGTGIQTVQHRGYWYAIDPRSGKPFGTPVVDAAPGTLMR